MNENTVMRYAGRPIDLNILSILDITSEGKVVSAADWNTLWETVLNKINTIDEYCVGIDTLVLDWKSTTEQLNATIADFNTKYEGLSNSFVHYGTEAPTNPHQRLWLKECDDVNLEGYVVRREFIQYIDKVMFDKVNKEYVDNIVDCINETLETKMTKFGEVLTPTASTPNGDISKKGVAVDLTMYDSAEINAKELKISGLTAPTDPKQATNKEYVDSLVGDINEFLETALNGGV